MNTARNAGCSPRGIAPRPAAAGQARGRGAAAPRRRCAVVAIASVGLAAAGCSAVSHAAAAPGTPTPGAAATATTPAPTTGPPASPTAPTSVATTSSPTGPPAAVPTLGRPAGVFAHGQGFGQVKPAEIFNGGDPTGLVTHVVWTSWGGSRAIGTGISDYVGPNQTVAEGREESATVVAFDLGTCAGKLMYRAVEWYFPQHKQAFDPGHYEDICDGTYVPAS